MTKSLIFSYKLIVLLIAKKEFLSSLLNGRLLISLLLSLALVALSARVLTRNYLERLDGLQALEQESRRELSAAAVYSKLRPALFFPPSLPSIFSKGVEGAAGNALFVSVGLGPQVASSGPGSNPLLASLPSLDLTGIIALLFSLLALSISYDAICGEKEAGTLRALFSNRLSRFELLGAKYAGCMLTMLLALLSAFAVAMIVIRYTGGPRVSLGSAELLAISLLFLASVAYVSLYCLSGLLISSLTARASAALGFSILLWLVSLVVLPNAANVIAANLVPITPLEEFAERERRLLEERNRAAPFPQIRFVLGSSGLDQGGGYDLLVSTPENFKLLKEYFSTYSSTYIEYGDKLWDLHMQRFNELFAQARLAERLGYLVPASVYLNLSSKIAATDAGTARSHLSRAREFRHRFIANLKGRGVFESSRYFSKLGDAGMLAQDTIKRIFFSQDLTAIRRLQESVEPIDTSVVPRPDRRPDDMERRLDSSLPGATALILFNLVLLVCCHAAVLRYDVR